MAETSWPYTDAPTTDLEYSQLMRELGQGITRSNGDSTLLGSADSSGMVSKVEAGRAIVRGYAYNNSAQLTVNHDASTVNPRIDTVVIQLDITAIAPAARAVIAIVKGTAATSPVAPTLTQTDSGIYQLPLYDAAVAGSATNISPGDITDRRVWMGKLTSEWTTTTRPASPAPSQLGYNRTLGYWERWNGAAWGAIDAQTVGGRQLLDGTSDPAGGLGVDNSLYFKYV